jgi:hypothetical protein
MNKTLWSLILILLITVSCTSNDSEDIILAKVYDKELKLNSFNYIFQKKELSSKDSITLLENFVKNWIDEQILVHSAQKNEEINLFEINAKAEHYKNTLIIHKNENLYIDKNLDTSFSENEITTYYKNHQDDFQLKDYLVKVLYLKIPIDAPDLNKVNKWYRLYNSESLQLIEAYSKTYATNFYYDDNNWMYFDELTKEIPLKTINKDKFITRKSKIRIDENGFIYFLNVIDYKLKNSISPITFERENIKQKILNIRIKNLRENFKQETIQKAYNEKSVEIY